MIILPRQARDKHRESTLKKETTRFLFLQEVQAALAKIVAAWKVEVATFTRSSLISPPLLPGEACEGCTVAICCDGDPFSAPTKPPTCDCDGKPYPPASP
jgi:hypothetical protein